MIYRTRRIGARAASAAAVAFACLACATGSGPPLGETGGGGQAAVATSSTLGAGAGTTTASSASTTTGASTSIGGTTTTGATSSSGATTSTTTSASSGAGGGLDPQLDLPDPGGTPCTTPGSMSQCPGIAVCRISSANGGTCESCSPCHNLGAACTASSDCDILFQCYKGRCTNICPLGTSYCGPVQNCLDVGNATYGVCKP